MKLKQVLMAVLTLAAVDAHAALYDRGNSMVYDSTLNITWLDITSSYGMTWNAANTWASNLNYNGINGWRLPSAGLQQPANPCTDYSGATGCDGSYNNTNSELGHLFYVDLGNSGNYSIAGEVQSNAGLSNVSFVDAGTNSVKSFSSLTTAVYWEAEEYSPDTSLGWFFYTGYGAQGFRDKSEANSAIVVHDGDVASVPVPAAAWLFVTSLIGLGGVARRRK